MFAALLYRMILTAYLDLKLAPRKPDTGLTKYENFRLDHFESGDYQRHIEAGSPRSCTRRKSIMRSAKAVLAMLGRVVRQ
jgi:hypothetical protein